MSRFRELIESLDYSPNDLPFNSDDIEEGCSEPNCTCNMFRRNGSEVLGGSEGKETIEVHGETEG